MTLHIWAYWFLLVPFAVVVVTAGGSAATKYTKTAAFFELLLDIELPLWFLILLGSGLIWAYPHA